jgi:septal ring factor EnvC (AmiA/AmiB activator)
MKPKIDELKNDLSKAEATAAQAAKKAQAAKDALAQAEQKFDSLPDRRGIRQ